MRSQSFNAERRYNAIQLAYHVRKVREFLALLNHGSDEAQEALEAYHSQPPRLRQELMEV